MNTPVRYLPLINGTAFMGMGTNTGLNEGHAYPYVLWEDYEALSVECAKWRHDAQQLALRDRDQTALENELAAERQRREADADYWLESFRRVNLKLDEVLAECANLPEDVRDVAKLELWAKEFRRNHPKVWGYHPKDAR